MFFYLAKAFWFFAQPSSLLLVMILGSVVLLQAGRDRAGFRLVAVSAALLLLGGSLPLGNLVLLPLEERFGRADFAGKPVDGIIVLGGGEDERISAGRNAHAMNEAAEGFTAKLPLVARYSNAKIVYSGGAI